MQASLAALPPDIHPAVGRRPCGLWASRLVLPAPVRDLGRLPCHCLPVSLSAGHGQCSSCPWPGGRTICVTKGVVHGSQPLSTEFVMLYPRCGVPKSCGLRSRVDSIELVPPADTTSGTLALLDSGSTVSPFTIGLGRLVIQIDAAINPGNSGGPVFDASDPSSKARPVQGVAS